MSIKVTGLTCEAIAEAIGNHLGARAYLQLPARGLVSSAFPDTFAPSAFHEDVVSRVHHGPNSESEERRMGVDWVFRHVDLDKVAGSPWHLSSFKMGVFFTASQRQADDTDLRAAIVQRFVELLGDMGLPVRKSMVTYFGGCHIGGRDLPPDDEVVDAWQQSGVRQEQLVPVRGRACFTNCERTGEPAGPRCEVFLPAADGRMVEVGTVVFERFVVEPGRGVVESGWIVYGGAVGIERVAMLRAGVTDVVEIPDIAPLIGLVRSSVDERLTAVCYQQLRGLVDGLRTLVVLRSQRAPLHRRHEQRVCSVARRVRRYLVDLGVEDSTLPVVPRFCAEAARSVHVDDSVVDAVLADMSSITDGVS